MCDRGMWGGREKCCVCNSESMLEREEWTLAYLKKYNVRDKYLIKALVCDMFSPSAVNLSLRQFEMKLEDSAKLNVSLNF